MANSTLATDPTNKTIFFLDAGGCQEFKSDVSVYAHADRKKYHEPHYSESI